VLSGVERRLKTNAYWSSAMEGWSRDAKLVEATRTLVSDLQSMTAEEVRAAVAKNVTDQAAWSMIILPGRGGAAVTAGSTAAAPPGTAR
jgi:hypothetical protein